MTTIEICADTFHAKVSLDMLPTLPVRNIRKLLQLIYSHSYENPESIWTLTDWLPSAVTDAKHTWGYAIVLYKDGYRAVKKGSRKKADVEQRAKNHVLADSVKDAKIAYEQLIKLQSIFNEIKEKC